MLPASTPINDASITAKLRPRNAFRPIVHRQWNMLYRQRTSPSSTTMYSSTKLSTRRSILTTHAGREAFRVVLGVACSHHDSLEVDGDMHVGGGGDVDERQTASPAIFERTKNFRLHGFAPAADGYGFCCTRKCSPRS